MEIVAARPSHLEAIARIYAEVVLDSPATFDLEPPGLEAWRVTLAGCDPARGHHLDVALAEGDVLGFAKSARFRDRAAYDSTCETSIYVAGDARRQGVGRALYSQLLEQLGRGPLRLAVAALTEPNPASAALHERLGFVRVGTLVGVGVKFDRAWDVTWYQRSLLSPSPADGP